MMDGMDDLVAFLRARIDEDEQAAKLMAQFYPPPWETSDRGWMARVMADGPSFWEVVRLEQWPTQPTGDDAPWLGDIIAHVARHDPARVLREVEAKRDVIDDLAGTLHAAEGDTEVDHYGGLVDAEQTLKRLAAVYDTHPDYREAWKP